MLCRADFEELFPEMFEPQVSATPAAPSDDCVARWEDDGGAPAPVVWKRSKSWRGYAASPMVAALLGLAAVHSAMQLSKVAMPPVRRILDVEEIRWLHSETSGRDPASALIGRVNRSADSPAFKAPASAGAFFLTP